MSTSKLSTEIGKDILHTYFIMYLRNRLITAYKIVFNKKLKREVKSDK